MSINELISRLEDEFGLIICKNGYEYSYIIPRRDELRRKDRARFDDMLELLKRLHVLAATARQAELARRVKACEISAAYQLADKRMLYVDCARTNYAVFAKSSLGVVKRYVHDKLPFRKSKDQSQQDLDEYAREHGLAYADATSYGVCRKSVPDSLFSADNYDE